MITRIKNFDRQKLITWSFSCDAFDHLIYSGSKNELVRKRLDLLILSLRIHHDSSLASLSQMLLQARHTVKWILLDYIADCKIFPFPAFQHLQYEQQEGSLGMRPAACTIMHNARKPENSHQLSEDDQRNPCWEWCMALPPQRLHWPERLRDMGQGIIMTSW